MTVALSDTRRFVLAYIDAAGACMQRTITATEYSEPKPIDLMNGTRAAYPGPEKIIIFELMTDTGDEILQYRMAQNISLSGKRKFANAEDLLDKLNTDSEKRSRYFTFLLDTAKECLN